MAQMVKIRIPKNSKAKKVRVRKAKKKKRG